MTEKEKFFERFKFDQEKIGCVGVEREQFTIDPKTGAVAPLAEKYLDCLRESGRLAQDYSNFGYELSACQLESKIGPCQIGELHAKLSDSERTLDWADHVVGARRVNLEIASESMPLDIYPDPTGRYQVITKNMPHEVLSAACRVAATHIHVGMSNLSAAINAYNCAIKHTERLIALGDNSSGQRMALYRVMATQYMPNKIEDLSQFYDRSVVHSFSDDPRRCWTLIRISVHGTIEFRMFGATDSLDQIVEWATLCRDLCA